MLYIKNNLLFIIVVNSHITIVIVNGENNIHKITITICNSNKVFVHPKFNESGFLSNFGLLYTI